MYLSLSQNGMEPIMIDAVLARSVQTRSGRALSVKRPLDDSQPPLSAHSEIMDQRGNAERELKKE